MGNPVTVNLNQCLDAINEYGLDEFDYVGGANIAGATIVINEMVNEK